MTPISTLLNTLRKEAQGILDLEMHIKASPHAQESIRHCIASLQACLATRNQIIVSGVGKSAIIGKKFVATLTSTGAPSLFMHPIEGLHGDLGIARDGDLALLLSHSGNSRELLDLVPHLRKRGVKLVALTRSQTSPLGRTCDICLEIPVETEACPFNLAPTTSTTTALALCDALALALLEAQKFDMAAFAANHPGGSLGQKLERRVSEVMIPASLCGSLTADALMDEVAQTLTDFPLGALTILDKDKKLLGLITEGDLRRAIIQNKGLKQAVFAKDIMTRQPLSIDSDSLAMAAYQMMEGGERPINVLVVLSKEGHWLGLLRIHDILRRT